MNAPIDPGTDSAFCSGERSPADPTRVVAHRSDSRWVRRARERSRAPQWCRSWAASDGPA